MLSVLGQDERESSLHYVMQTLNERVHGKPGSAVWSTIQMDGGIAGHAPSKILDNPTTCGRICNPPLAMVLVVEVSIAEPFG